MLLMLPDNRFVKVEGLVKSSISVVEGLKRPLAVPLRITVSVTTSDISNFLEVGVYGRTGAYRKVHLDNSDDFLEDYQGNYQFWRM